VDQHNIKKKFRWNTFGMHVHTCTCIPSEIEFQFDMPWSVFKVQFLIIPEAL